MKEFVECTLCIGIKIMPVCISACLSLLHFPVPFSLSFLTIYSFSPMRPVVLQCFTVGVILLPVHVGPLTSTPIVLSSYPLPPSPHPLPSNQFNLAPSLGQPHCVETRRWGEEGDWRRRDHLWDISLSRPPRCIARSFWDTLVTGLVLLNRTT